MQYLWLYCRTQVVIGASYVPMTAEEKKEFDERAAQMGLEGEGHCSAWHVRVHFFLT